MTDIVELLHDSIDRLEQGNAYYICIAFRNSYNKKYFRSGYDMNNWRALSIREVMRKYPKLEKFINDHGQELLDNRFIDERFCDGIGIWYVDGTSHYNCMYRVDKIKEFIKQLLLEGE